MARLSSPGETTPPGSPAGKTRITVAQALVKFLGVQYSESDGEEQKLFAGCLGIFGHGNVAGVGQALLQAELEEPDALRWWDVPVSETSTLDSTQQARKTYDKHKATQRLFL